MKKGGKITLYHFCAARDVNSIRESGLLLGMTPVIEGKMMKIVHDTQWLTDDPDPANQSWHTHNLVSYSRLAYRLTIDIPYSRRKKVVPALQFIQRYEAANEGLVTGWPGSEHWYVYTGRIPANWIVGCRKLDC